MYYPGRIGLTRISGATGALITLGQLLDGDGFTTNDHAFMDLGDGNIIEAEPGGARIRPITEYDGKAVYWCDAIYNNLANSICWSIVREARNLEGTPYSAADYFALVGHRLHLDTESLKRYIASSGHLICSQLVDLAYQRGGYQIFSDGRWPGYVTPGDLYRQDQYTKNWETISWDSTWPQWG
jgi:hypothetical protein